MHYELLIFFFLIALLYASVGFGGGSSYLAILALFSFDYQMIRITALLCNLVVVFGGCLVFYKSGFFNWRKMLPLVLFSVPLAFLGGRIQISEERFFIILGFTLFLAGIMILVRKNEAEESGKAKELPLVGNAGLGGGIGLLSGLVGIGGGIFLSPILHLINWDKAKTIAATASFYILVNSISGIAGQLSRGLPTLNWSLIAGLLMAVLIGGQIGSRIGAKKLPPIMVRRATAILVLFVSVRILLKYF